MMALRRLRPDIPLPSLVVIFDDFAGFIGEHHDRLRELESMASAAGQVDLHLILSVASINSIHARIQQNIQNRLALGQTYTLDVFGQRAKPLPDILGRGYILEDQALLECQIAAPILQADEGQSDDG
jgi:DNA segregation ATPase FtsK/SpoIIIE-like protein